MKMPPVSRLRARHGGILLRWGRLLAAVAVAVAVELRLEARIAARTTPPLSRITR